MPLSCGCFHHEAVTYLMLSPELAGVSAGPSRGWAERSVPVQVGEEIQAVLRRHDDSVTGPGSAGVRKQGARRSFAPFGMTGAGKAPYECSQEWLRHLCRAKARRYFFAGFVFGLGAGCTALACSMSSEA